MTAKLPNPLPNTPLPMVDNFGRPVPWFSAWVSTLDAALRAFFGVATTANTAGAPLIGPLTNAASDAAAAAAGVPLNGLYRTGNSVQIRLV